MDTLDTIIIGHIFGCKPLSFWVAKLRFLYQVLTTTRFSATTLRTNSRQVHHGSQVLEIICSVVFVFHTDHILLQWAAFLSLEVGFRRRQPEWLHDVHEHMWKKPFLALLVRISYHLHLCFLWQATFSSFPSEMDVNGRQAWSWGDVFECRTSFSGHLWDDCG